MFTKQFPTLDLTKFRLYWPPYSACTKCGCTEYDCRQCIARTGEPCWWVTPYLCSACAPVPQP